MKLITIAAAVMNNLVKVIKSVLIIFEIKFSLNFFGFFCKIIYLLAHRTGHF